MRPDHVLDDRRRGLAGVARRSRYRSSRGQHVAALDEPHELVDDVRRVGADVALVAIQRQDVPAQEHVAAEALLQLAEDPPSRRAPRRLRCPGSAGGEPSLGSAEPLPDGGADALAVGASTGLPIATPMALPMSCMPVAPDSGDRLIHDLRAPRRRARPAGTRRSSWASASSAVARSSSPPPRYASACAAQAALALPAEHGDLVVAARLQVLLKRVGDQPQGAGDPRSPAFIAARCRFGSARGCSRPYRG